jgi:hypothetical protein
MKRQELYNNTVDILVQAYFNDTLAHCDCSACAVGNMIAGNCGYELKYVTEDVSGFIWLHNGKEIEPKWDELFVTYDNGNQKIEPRCFNLETKRQCEATGYNWHDLAAIGIRI